jgi:hypothetical protein
MTPVWGRGAVPNGESPGDHEYAHHDYSTWDAAYVLGSLSANDRREFEAHMGGCASCREAVTELSGMPAVLALLDRDEVAAIDEGDRVWRSGLWAHGVDGLSGPLEPQTILPFFRSGNYAPVPDELTAFDLAVEGSIPTDLNGWYLRNGPNPREAIGHWFTGDGMIHGVRLENGRAAWYRNRWVRTESFEHPFGL